jgi:GxxExxY protein
MDKHLSPICRIAEDVYKALGSGHPEVVYDRAMQVGLRLDGIKYESQKVIELKYRGFYVGEGYPDLLVQVDGKSIVVELKAVAAKMGACEERQLQNYLDVLGLECGLLINFQMPVKKGSELEIKEVRRSSP